MTTDLLQQPDPIRQGVNRPVVVPLQRLYVHGVLQASHQAAVRLRGKWGSRAPDAGLQAFNPCRNPCCTVPCCLAFGPCCKQQTAKRVSKD
jgi:hypothetical protein